MTLIFVFALFLGSLVAQESEFVRSVEQNRGGRHWVDRKTDPPKSAQESHACFQIEPGCRIDLVVAEPLVVDPVALEFDERGRMFVAEYSDYPVGPKDPAAPRLSKIVLLEDTDGDGSPDRRTVFAENLAFCHSVMPLLGGILTCTETEIVYLKDTNDDRIADVREIWYSGFTPAHPQMQIGCPRWGLDNWIYLTYGPGNIRCQRPGFETKEAVKLGGQDFRFHLLTMQFESLSGLGQFGNTFDNDGHRFFSTNRNPMMTDVLPPAVLSRNPFAGLTGGHMDVGPAGENTRVYPLVDMKSNYLSHAGTHTSACGVTAYRGELFEKSFQHSVFVCEPVGHLVTRSITAADGATLTATRAREKADFLASTDTWFRPASLLSGPDGALYVADMYRLWVEHPKFVPDDVAAKMDWRAGEDRGRIWKITPEPPGPVRAFPSTETDLVALLRDVNGWRRTLGQRLIVERQLMSVESAVRQVSRDSAAGAHSRMQALWTLDGLSRCTQEDLLLATSDGEWQLRRDGVRIAARRFPNDPRLIQQIERLCTDSVAEVRLQALIALGSMSSAGAPVSAERDEVLGRAAVSVAHDWWLTGALLSSSAHSSGVILKHLTDAWRTAAADSRVVAPGESSQTRVQQTELLIRLSSIAAARSDHNELRQVFALIADAETGRSVDQKTADPKGEALGQAADFWWKTAMLVGVAEGLSRSRSPEIPKSLTAFLSHAPAGFEDAVVDLRRMMEQSVTVAGDSGRSETERLAAIRLLQYQPPEVMSAAVSGLLHTGQPVSCQAAALNAVRQLGRADLVMMVLDQWDSLSPSIRAQTLDLVLNRTETVMELLRRMQTGVVSPSVVSIDQRLRLLQFPDDSVKQLAGSLFGGTVSANRKEVADQYADALTLSATAAAGAKVFEKTCSKCHRIDGVGHQVGPDISDTRSRARDALLYDILDPNRRVDPQYTDYVTVLRDGRTLNGLLVSETSDQVVLRQPEGLQQTILRQEIEELRSTNRSLMPEGVEKDLSVQQMADLLEFLKSR